MTVIAVSGTQGAGKSTLLNLVKERGYNVDDFKVSRFVQQRYGKLSDIISSSTVVRFQEDVFNFKYLNDSVLSLKDELYFVERSFIDIASYTTLWIEKYFPDLQDWKNDYVEKCLKAQDYIYDGIINITFHPEMNFEIDENRASLEDVHLYEKIFDTIQSKSNVRSLEINDLDIEKRFEILINFSKMVN